MGMTVLIHQATGINSTYFVLTTMPLCDIEAMPTVDGIK